MHTYSCTRLKFCKICLQNLAIMVMALCCCISIATNPVGYTVVAGVRRRWLPQLIEAIQDYCIWENIRGRKLFVNFVVLLPTTSFSHICFSIDQSDCSIREHSYWLWHICEHFTTNRRVFCNHESFQTLMFSGIRPIQWQLIVPWVWKKYSRTGCSSFLLFIQTYRT